MIEASIVKDSISNEKHRLTTFKLRYPKFIHGEFMTHRTISRNASSSRAVPFNKLVQEATDGRLQAYPEYIGREQKGMQSGAPFTEEELNAIAWDWKDAADAAARYAKTLAQRDVHKSICNRLIEPFTHINVVASATENGWLNFFGLRLDSAAEPTMRALAIAMFDKYCESKPQLLLTGWWHLPLWDVEDSDQFRDRSEDEKDFQIPLKVSVARCARVSYESFETGKRSTIDEDLKLYDRLVGAQPLHASPAEHQATPDYRPIGESWSAWHQHGNFDGWRQYRKMLPGEAIAPLPEEFRERYVTSTADFMG